MTIIRFAPSPTGPLHIGNIRTAFIAWLWARSQGGKFILRIDDTDQVRSEARYVEAIKEDLTWLGITWDECFFQSDRIDRYKEVQQQLIANGNLYPCYESQEELQIRRRIAINAGKPPIYDRAALRLTEEDRQKLEQNGLRPHWRFFLKPGKIQWDDLIRNQVTFDANNLSDPIWIREDGTITYSIASVIDDIDYKITDIVRGEDHISNSATHIRLFEALNSPIPNFAHLSLLQSKGEKISKRLGGFSIQELREAGAQPMAILSLIAKIGTADSIDLYNNLQELLDNFSIKKISNASVFYDENDIFRLNAKILHQMSYNDLIARFDCPQLNENIWNAIRENVVNFIEIQEWCDIICNQRSSKILCYESHDSPIILEAAIENLPNTTEDEKTWHQWIEAIKSTINVAGKDIFLTLRIAITGLDYGPHMAKIISVMKRSEIIKRLQYVYTLYELKIDHDK